MADEVEIPTARVDDVAEARNALWRCATELKAISSAEVILSLAEGLNAAAAALDGFVAELAAERLGEFPVNRWPAGESELAELSEADDMPDPVDEAPAVEAPDAPDDPRNDVLPDAEPEDALSEGDSEDEAQGAPALDHEALVIRARKHKIKGYTKMSDAELAEAVAKAES